MAERLANLGGSLTVTKGAGRKARGFRQQLQGFVGRLEDFGAEELNELTRQVFDTLVDRTPKASGRARAGWAIALNGPGSHVASEGAHSDPSSGDFDGLLAGASWDDRRVIYNRTPYILKLENGSSRQAPRGMVAIAKRRAKTRRGRRM